MLLNTIRQSHKVYIADGWENNNTKQFLSQCTSVTYQKINHISTLKNVSFKSSEDLELTIRHRIINKEKTFIATDCKNKAHDFYQFALMHGLKTAIITSENSDRIVEILQDTYDCFITTSAGSSGISIDNFDDKQSFIIAYNRILTPHSLMQLTRRNRNAEKLNIGFGMDITHELYSGKEKTYLFECMNLMKQHFDKFTVDTLPILYGSRNTIAEMKNKRLQQECEEYQMIHAYKYIPHDFPNDIRTILEKISLYTHLLRIKKNDKTQNERIKTKIKKIRRTIAIAVRNKKTRIHMLDVIAHCHKEERKNPYKNTFIRTIHKCLLYLLIHKKCFRSIQEPSFRQISPDTHKNIINGLEFFDHIKKPPFYHQSGEHNIATKIIYEILKSLNLITQEYIGIFHTIQICLPTQHPLKDYVLESITVEKALNMYRELSSQEIYHALKIIYDNLSPVEQNVMQQYLKYNPDIKKHNQRNLRVILSHIGIGTQKKHALIKLRRKMNLKSLFPIKKAPTYNSSTTLHTQKYKISSI